MEVSPQEIKDIHRYQVGALAAFARAAGTTLQHVKAHGIQYHMFEENLPLGRASAEQVVELDPNLILMTMAMTKYDAEARKVKGCRVAGEGFADRVYADDGQLVSRKLGKDALVSDPAKAADQAVRMVMEHKVRTITGKIIDARIDTICIHGDSPGAEKIVPAVRDALVKAGALVQPLPGGVGAEVRRSGRSSVVRARVPLPVEVVRVVELQHQIAVHGRLVARRVSRTDARRHHLDARVGIRAVEERDRIPVAARVVQHTVRRREKPVV